MFSLRPGAVEAVAQAGAGEVVNVDVPEQAENAVKIVKAEPNVGGDRPSLTEASIVVSGGRGVGSAEKFAPSSRPSPTRSVPPSAPRVPPSTRLLPRSVSRSVRPADRVAATVHRPGYLGAIQHRRHADLEDHRITVNKDEEAPIFGSPTSVSSVTCSTSHRSSRGRQRP